VPFLIFQFFTIFHKFTCFFLVLLLNRVATEVDMDIHECWQLIADCEKRESKLSDWDRGFIDSIQKRLGDNKTLTKKQQDKLSGIWDACTEDG
jgi:hypothetical protein